MTLAGVEEVRLWLAAVAPTTAIVFTWVMLKRQLLLMHAAQVAALKNSLERIERAMNLTAGAIAAARRTLEERR